MSQAIIGRWGKNLAVRVPSAVADAAGLNEGEKVEVDLIGPDIVIRRPSALARQRQAEQAAAEITAESERYTLGEVSTRELREEGVPTSTPVSMRLPDNDLAIIDRAADLQGRSRTDFVRDAAVRAAEEVLLEQRVVRMSPEDFEAFKDAISTPGKPVPEMVERLRRRAPWDRD
jgi:uncharacterized protein (DUF1778 family)/antitoxin component of MazEF toxin-antitoxin module